MFISLLVGAFSLGQAAPCLQDFSVALGAAGFIYDTIDRVSVTCILQHVIEVEYVYCNVLTRPATIHHHITRYINSDIIMLHGPVCETHLSVPISRLHSFSSIQLKNFCFVCFRKFTRNLHV